ncbi:fimbria/pilus periplasmic chaperone [Klebsiella oxytoca]|uniref:fimbria/pilus periplasmic chaperone n=1 Tax=Klebsiella oxytoca TaxID=571 RepID=UPI001B3302CA|nr:fimbria/pilus periplasmic chaperone [Klebsiella oxytoca]EJM1003864.1 fimbria/pilus periplasmic chaperone [Klebsiella oxytoca]EKQ7242551.1 fimbria/pilus periplasmic chaperone [Klebsiella oxytoca]WBD78226.1 fimbria/pilus periplasmic chaperone [Klebsiella oxytoca]HBC8616436.1 fimbria/pilus periplasmic chaperone [Klebsiella oxytoca]
MQLISFSLRNLFRIGFLVCLLPLSSVSVMADGGISVVGTRFVYPQGEKQLSIKANNTSKTESFLVQSWVENEVGEKTKDFIVTPPLYVSKPQKGTSLRLVYTGPELPKDRETLYYFITKSIPAVEKDKTEGKSVLVIAMATRLKVFVRPNGLKPDISEAPSKMVFRKAGKNLEISNPTPYYVTMTELSAGSQTLKNIMVPPKGKITVNLLVGNKVSFRTVDDYGTFSPLQHKTMM